MEISCSSTLTTTRSSHEREKNPSPNSPPKLLPRSDSNPYPTTFVQADTSNFKHVVQMLTGSSDSPRPPPHHPPPPTPPSSNSPQDPFHSSSKNNNCSNNFSIPPIKTTAPKKQHSFKLYERRNHLKNSLMINTLIPNFSGGGGGAAGFSPRNAEILSPSILDFPSLALSPVTPLNDDASLGSSSEEERAIAEKGFYLHPSPMNTPRAAEPPQLLSLFPETSPRVSGSSS